MTKPHQDIDLRAILDRRLEQVAAAKEGDPYDENGRLRRPQPLGAPYYGPPAPNPHDLPVEEWHWQDHLDEIV